MDKQNYRVTDKAGPRINGQRVVVGQVLALTAAEARYHADLQELDLVQEKAEAPSAPPAGKR